MRRLKKELNSIDWRAGAYATKFLTRTVCQWFLVSLRVSDWLFFYFEFTLQTTGQGHISYAYIQQFYEEQPRYSYFLSVQNSRASLSTNQIRKQIT